MARSIGLTACLLVLSGCGSGSGDIPDVELQIINAVSNDINRNLTLRVETPHDSAEERPFPYGDSTNEANWVKLHVPLVRDDVVSFKLLNSGGAQVMVTSCIVGDIQQFGYLKALLSPVDLDGHGRHVDCAEGFVDNTP